MKILEETRKSLARVTEEVIIDVTCGIVGAVGKHVIAPFFTAVIKYDFLWRNPNASKDATDLRVKQESELLIAKLSHEYYPTEWGKDTTPDFDNLLGDLNMKLCFVKERTESCICLEDIASFPDGIQKFEYFGKKFEERFGGEK